MDLFSRAYTKLLWEGAEIGGSVPVRVFFIAVKLFEAAGRTFVREVAEERELAQPGKFYVPDRPVTLFGDDNFREPFQVLFFRLFLRMVIFFATSASCSIAPDSRR